MMRNIFLVGLNSKNQDSATLEIRFDIQSVRVHGAELR